MNGTKWYKLNKSNEPLEVFLEERFAELESTMSSKISSGIVNIGEIVFSVGLTFLLEIKVDPFEKIWGVLPFFKGNTPSFITTSASCIIIFLLSIAISHLVILCIKKVKAFFSDNKSTPSEAYKLEEYFYKKVLNDIVTGISLEKKSSELLQNIKKSETKEQDIDLYLIYLMESTFYFNQAISHITERNIVEIDNPNRTEYTDFLQSVNPNILCDIFTICISTLKRIIPALDQHGQSVENASDACKTFQDYIKAIKEQTSPQNKASDRTSSISRTSR